MNPIFQKNRIFTYNVNATGAGGLIPVTAVVGDGLLAVIPAGYMLEIAIAQETGGADIEIRLGTAAGLDDIAPGQTATASTCTALVLNRPPSTVAYNVFISDTGAGWGASSLNMYLLLRKVF